MIVNDRSIAMWSRCGPSGQIKFHYAVPLRPCHNEVETELTCCQPVSLLQVVYIDKRCCQSNVELSDVIGTMRWYIGLVAASRPPAAWP